MEVRGSHTGVNVALLVLTVLLAGACVVGGVKAQRTQEDRAHARAEQERYGDVLAAATSGALRELATNRSVMDGTVVWAGVVDVDGDSATVIAATSGTVANVRTDGKAVARNYRLLLDLVLQDGQWLTRDLQFVR